MSCGWTGCLLPVSSQLHDLEPRTQAQGPQHVRGPRRLQVREGEEEVLQVVRLSESRGWGPLNKILLSHPEIISTKPTSEITDIPAPNMISNDSSSASVSSSPSSDNSKKGIDVADMNISEGFAKVPMLEVRVSIF